MNVKIIKIEILPFFNYCIYLVNICHPEQFRINLFPFFIMK